MRHIIKKILKEELKKKVYPVNWDLINISNGEVECYHYSNEDFDGVVKTTGSMNLYSKSEFKEWGKSRSFFYLTEGGVYKDKGVGRLYKYKFHIPLNEIYDINKNSNNYNINGNWGNIYSQISNDGYSAWVYNLGGKENTPILVSFKSVPITEKYELISSGVYKLSGEELEDEVVGVISKRGHHMLVLQKPYYPINSANLFAILPKDLNKKLRYESPIEFFEVNDIKFKDEFKRKYID